MNTLFFGIWFALMGVMALGCALYLARKGKTPFIFFLIYFIGVYEIGLSASYFCKYYLPLLKG